MQSTNLFILRCFSPKAQGLHLSGLGKNRSTDTEVYTEISFTRQLAPKRKSIP